MAGESSIGETLNAAVGPAVSALNRLAASLANPLQATVDRLAQATSQAVGGMQQAVAGLGQIVKGSPVQGAMNVFAGALNSAVGPLSSLVDATRGFVEALAPGTMEAFNQAVSNLQATIGVAFEPIFQVLTDTLARVASTLAPVFETLRPIVEQVVQALSERLLTVVVTLANLFEAFAPFLKLAADLFAALNPIINAVVAVLGALVEALLGFLAGLLGGEGGMRDFARQLADAIRQMTVAILAFIIQLGDAFGAENFGNAILRNLQPAQRGREQVAAFRNVQVQDFSAVARDLAVAAAAASGQGMQANQATNADIVAEVARLRTQPPEWMRNIPIILREMQNALAAILQLAEGALGVGEAVRERADQVISRVRRDPVGNAIQAAANPVGWAWHQVFG